LEAASPGKALPSKQELLDFQARWMRPAGVCAILGALIIAASLPLQPSSGGDDDAEQLTELHGQSTELIVGQGIMIGVAVLLFIPLLYVLIRAAAGRTERIRRGMVSLAFVGPILFAVAGLMVSTALNDVADKFIDQAPATERQARERAAAAQEAAAARGAGEGRQQPKQAAQGQTTQVPPTTQPTTTPGTTTGAQGTTTVPRTPEQAVSDARDDLADDLIDDSGLLQAGSLLRFVGLLSLVFAMIYIPLWAMRTGLLTRFWAMVGVALGVSLVLLPVGIFGLVIWFAVVGLMLAGWWFRPLPPAWAAGEAIPWPRPGDDIGPPPEDRGGPGTVEGSGREVSERAPPEEGEPGAEPSQPGETQGQRRKKRKRRN
jgi:hypothetical protein